MDKKAQMGTTAVVTTVITLIIMVVIGVIIVAEMTGAINVSTYSTDAQNAFDTVVGHGWTALTLVGILILVVVGVAMIGVMTLLRT